MDPLTAIALINSSVVVINAAFEIIGRLKKESGLSDQELSDLFITHGEATSAAIKGYLDNLPKK